MGKFAEAYRSPAVRKRHWQLVRGEFRRCGVRAFLIIGVGLAIVIVLMEIVFFIDALADPRTSGFTVATARDLGLVGLPVSAIVSILAGALVGLGAAVLQHMRLIRTGAAVGAEFCHGCGYSRSGHKGTRCPECGEVIDGAREKGQ